MLKINSSNTKLVTHDIYDVVDIFDNINDGKDLRGLNSWGMIFNSTPEIMEKIEHSMYEMCPITSNFMAWEYGEVRVCHAATRSLASLSPIDVSIFDIAKHLPNRLNMYYRGDDKFLLIRIAMSSDAICEVSASIAKRSTVTFLFEQNYGIHMRMKDEDFITLFDNIVKNNKAVNCPTNLAYERIHKDLAYSCIPIKFDKSKLKELEYLNF